MSGTNYTASLRLAEPVPGNPAVRNTWGATLNIDMTLIEAAITGKVAVALTGATATLTAVNGATDQSRNQIIEFTGTPGTTCTVTMPAVSKLGLFVNSTSDDSVVILTTGSGTTATLPQDDFWYLMWCDGTNVTLLPFGAGSMKCATATVTGAVAAGSVGVGGNLTADTLNVASEAVCDWDVAGPTNYSVRVRFDEDWEDVFVRGFSVPGVLAGLEVVVGTFIPSSFFFQNDGNATAPGSWVSLSDARVKTNLRVIDDPLEKLFCLTGYTYDRTDLVGMNGDPVRQAGVIAQDLERAVPEGVVEGLEPPQGHEGERPTLSVDHGATIGLLVEACKALKAELDALKAAGA